MTKKIFFMLISIFISIVWIGCEKSSSSKKETKETLKLPKILVESEWLKNNINNEKLTILDVRNADEYKKGHIPGAVHYPIKNTYHPSPKSKVEKNNLAPIDHIEKTLGQAGVSLSQTVVIYDDGVFKYAARVFWVLEVHGHNQVAVLNGGYPKWLKEKRDISTKEVTVQPKKFISNMQPERLVTKLEVARVVDNKSPGVAIFDVRTKEEFIGKKTITPPRAGHIVGAHNINWVDSLNFEDNICTLNDINMLKKLYSPYKDSKKVITYCNKGKRASASYLTLRLLGYNVGVYDGSWLEWGSDPKLPIER